MTAEWLERARVAARMEHDRRALREAVATLRSTAQAELAPRALVGKHPLPFLAGAFLLGLSARRPRLTLIKDEPITEGAESMRYTNQFTGDAADEVSSPPPEGTRELDQRVADAKARLAELDRRTRRLVQERPMAAFGLALAAGLLLGRALSRR